MKIFSKSKEDDFILEQDDSNTITTGSSRLEPSHILTADEVINTPKSTAAHYDGKSALEALKKRMQQSGESVKEPEPAPKKQVVTPKEKPSSEKAAQKSLLEKCKPFTTDDSGKDAALNSAPLYKLQTVAEILENRSLQTISSLAEQYDITVDDLGKKKEAKPEPVKPTAQDKEIIEINAFFENVQSSVPLAVSEVESDIPVSDNTSTFADNATITFTPVSDDSAKKPKVVVSSNTQSIDLTGEFSAVAQNEIFSKSEQVTLEKNEFEDFTPQDEIHDEYDSKRHIRKLSIKKRTSFLSVCLSVILTLVLAFMKLPFMTGVILGKTQTAMIICTAILGAIILLNCNMFLSLPKIFSKKSVADSSLSLASVFVLAYAVMGIISGEIVLDILLLFAITLSIRALSRFRKDSYTLSNLKQISTSGQKNALRLIDDTAVTFAMAKNSVEGDTLIAAPQKCERVTDFIKYSTFGTFLNGKLSVISIVALIISLATGFAAANYYDGLVHGLYAAAAVQCFACLPSIFFIKEFPLYSAAKKLNRNGAMIAGAMGASHIEMANALMLNSSDVFPKGTVTLHQMKVLSDNNLDQTLLAAASLTECLKSPLAPIFKKIAGESNIDTLPNSDTIKYEERMGISGWVDDKLLFIGNRTLMEAHGIAVPDIELDRKILRNGYFPVYVASEAKACALLVVQYSVDPDVAHELHRLTKIGVTLLVNNTDPNISAEMICDYLGLYDDSVMIMTNAGYHMYKNTATPKESCSAPACFRKDNLVMAKIINCANKIRRSNTLLTILYVLSAILGIIIFAYSSFTGSRTIIDGSTVLLYSLISTAVTYLLYLIEKP